jgi:hypothetical protein
MLAFWQFGSAGMLAWGAAAALPILIHLWSRRKYRQERWAAMMFLLAALRKNARRIQVEQWILLAVRSLILVLFAMALADPRSSLLSSWTSDTSEQTHVILVLDGSYSMGYRAGDGTRFQAAKNLAKQLATDDTQSAAYSLVLMSRPPRVIISEPAFDPKDVRQELDDLELQHSGADLPATLAEVENILRRSKTKSDGNNRLRSRHVCVFTDLQQATWDDITTPECRAQMSRMESLATWQLVDLGQGGESNLAIARLSIDQPVVAAGRDVQIEADIQSYAREDRQRQTVEVRVDGAKITERRIDCPTNGRVTVSVVHRFDAPGEHVIEVHLADDGLPLDNRRWLSVPVRKAVRVLCIGGRPSETRLIALALAPQKSEAQHIEVVKAPESRLLEDELADFDGLVVSNLGRLSRSEAAALHRFASRGGGLLIFLGDQVQAENYNQLLVDDSKLHCLPARLMDLGATGTYTFDPLEYRHPITAPFRGFPKSGLITTPTWEYVRLAPLEGTKTAIAFSSGDPAIVETQVGRGRCILVATAASPDSVDRSHESPTAWTALPTWPSFPPLLHEMLRWAMAGRTVDRNVTVGDDLSGLIGQQMPDTVVSLKGPAGVEERLPIRDDAGERRWTLNHSSLSGIYKAQIGAMTQLYAVNVDSSEGRLTRLDRESLPSQFRHESGGRMQDSSPLPSHAAKSYFRWLLALVLILLVTEPCLAWQFGRGRT